MYNPSTCDFPAGFGEENASKTRNLDWLGNNPGGRCFLFFGFIPVPVSIRAIEYTNPAGNRGGLPCSDSVHRGCVPLVLLQRKTVILGIDFLNTGFCPSRPIRRQLPQCVHRPVA